MSQVNLKDVQDKLYEKLKQTGWDKVLKTFVLSSDFYSILEKLWIESEDGKKFTPIVKDLFRAFEECPYDNLRVVLVGQDPYPKLGVADGIAFSCSKSDIQPSLRYIYTGIENEGIDCEKQLDLKHWSNQGVLMLNTALTTQINKIGTHVELWKPFTSYLLNTLSAYNTGVIYIFMGKKAAEFSYLVDEDMNHKLYCSHPASAAYSHQKYWDSNNVFGGTNDILKKMYNQEIKW